MPEGAMVELGLEDKQGVGDSPGERRDGEERPRPAGDGPESGARGGGGGGGRRPRCHVPFSQCSAATLLSLKQIRCDASRRRLRDDGQHSGV